MPCDQMTRIFWSQFGACYLMVILCTRSALLLFRAHFLLCQSITTGFNIFLLGMLQLHNHVLYPRWILQRHKTCMLEELFSGFIHPEAHVVNFGCLFVVMYFLFLLCSFLFLWLLYILKFNKLLSIVSSTGQSDSLKGRGKKHLLIYFGEKNGKDVYYSIRFELSKDHQPLLFLFLPRILYLAVEILSP